MRGIKKDEGKAPARLFYFEGFNSMHEVKFFKTYEKLHKTFVKSPVPKDKLFGLGLLEGEIVESLTLEDLSVHEILFGVTRVSELGAKKYGVFNYQKGMKWSRVLNALGRHMIQYVSGEDIDLESKEDHRFHMLANIYMLAYYVKNEEGEDDLFEETI